VISRLYDDRDFPIIRIAPLNIQPTHYYYNTTHFDPVADSVVDCLQKEGVLKAMDIRSFFGKPGGGASQGSQAPAKKVEVCEYHSRLTASRWHLDTPLVSLEARLTHFFPTPTKPLPNGTPKGICSIRQGHHAKT
jgi:hypothetical protein